MSALAKQLKSEIVRVATKQVRTHLQQVRKTVVQQKRENIALKKRVASLERLLARQAPAEKVAKAVQPKAGRSALRFSAVGFANLRKKLGLNAAQTALVLGVSDQSVYKWEQGKSRPRASQLQSIAQLRAMGKRAVAKRLAEIPQS